MKRFDVAHYSSKGRVAVPPQDFYPAETLGQRIRTALDSGVPITASSPETFDDDGTDVVDPLSNIRSDRWDEAERLGDEAARQAVIEKAQHKEVVPQEQPEDAQPSAVAGEQSEA